MIDTSSTNSKLLQSRKMFSHTKLLEGLLDIEHRFGKDSSNENSKVAVFDLDNTLLVGDIGDAVYAKLLTEGFHLPLPWSDYQRMSQEDPRTAYIEAVSAMDGLPVDYLIHMTKCLLLSGTSYINCDGTRIPVPVPNKILQQLIHLLQEFEYQIYIISASNDISAKVAGSAFFDIPEENIAGIKSEIVDGKLTNKIFDPVPIGKGKILQYRLLNGNIRPLIVAIDNEIDLPLLHLCDPNGLIILAGNNEYLYEKANKELGFSKNIHLIYENNLLFFQ